MFDIQTDLYDLELLSGIDAPLVGRAWININGIMYPGEGWSDFISSVLGTIVAAMQELTNGKNDAYSYFFEGPYYIYYRRIESSDFRVYVEANCDRTEPPVCLSSTEVSARAIIRSLDSAYTQLFTKCQELNMVGPHINTNRLTYASLQRIRTLLDIEPNN